jgi:hypothetical protein
MVVPTIWPVLQEIMAGTKTEATCSCDPCGTPAVGDSVIFREASGLGPAAAFVPGGDHVTVVLTSVEDAGAAGETKMVRVRWHRRGVRRDG